MLSSRIPYYNPPVSKVRERLNAASSLPLPALLPPVVLLILLLLARALAHDRSLYKAIVEALRARKSVN